MKGKKSRRNSKNRRIALILALIVLIGVSGAAYYLQKNQTGNDTNLEVPTKEESYINPLTGLATTKDKKDKRPVAVMVENSKQALPQWGLSSADIVYETVVEGGITRNMALFSDIDDIKKIGPVRSVREYYPPIAASFDSLFIHFGGSETGYDAIKTNSLKDIDGINTPKAFLQDSSRMSRGKEHTYYTTNELLNSVIKEKNINMKQKTKEAFNFGNDEYKVTDTASNVSFSFSNYCNASFAYDETTGKYKKSEFSAPQNDGNTNSQLEVDNVLLLYANVTTQADGVHKSINLSGGGEGIYLNKGNYSNINWSKSKSDSFFELKDSDGNNLKVNSGKFFICMIPNEMKSSVKIVKNTSQ